MQTFKIENIQVPPIEIRADLKDDGLLELQTEIMGTIKAEIVELNSRAIRDSLISMGWTPPETGKEIGEIIRCARNAVNALDDHKDWHELKEAIGELASAVDGFEPADD